MTTPEELYVNGVKKRFRNYFAAWPPNEPIELGDIGVLDGNIFVRTKSVAASEIGISFSERRNSQPSPIDIVSEDGVSIVVKAAGELNKSALPNIPKGEAGLSIEFSKKGAFILNSPATYFSSIEDINKLGQEIIEAFTNRQWAAQWAVVVKVIKAPKATIIVSRSSNSKIEFLVQGDIRNGPIDLGNGNLNFSMRSMQGDIFQSVGASNTTPLFQLARLRKHFFKADEFEPIVRSGTMFPIDLLAPIDAQTDSSLDFDLITDLFS